MKVILDKKIFILAITFLVVLLLFIALTPKIFAATNVVFIQSHFKIYQDDAGLNSATQYANEDTNYNVTAGVNFRIRFEVRNSSGTLLPSIIRRLEFKEDSGAWTQITTNSNNVRLQDSANFTDGDATTARLTPPTSPTFVPGQGKDTSSDTSSVSLSASGYYVEDEYSLNFQSAAAGHTYQFRITKAGTALASYTQTPSISPVSADTTGPGMASTNYKILASDINAGGRDDQTSATSTYKMQDTIGGIATGISESALYKLMAGYRTLDDLSISFSISDLAIGFGTFSSTNSRWATSDETAGDTSEPANQNPTYITISTNAPYGAIVSARSKGSGTGVEVNGSAGLYKSSSPTKLIAATACTTVADGTESYALYVKNVGTNLTAASGFNGGSCTGTISTTNQTILTASVPLSINNTADVVLKAAIASTTSTGSYADVITLTGTGKF